MRHKYMYDKVSNYSSNYCVFRNYREIYMHMYIYVCGKRYMYVSGTSNTPDKGHNTNIVDISMDQK